MDPISISHVASPVWCYPGEPVVLHTRLVVHRAVQALQLRVLAPAFLPVADFWLPENVDTRIGSNARVAREGTDQWVDWQPGALAPGSYDLKLMAAAGHVTYSGTDDWIDAQSTAKVSIADARFETSAVVRIKRRAAYLKYLPGLYRDDELMGKLLMLAESFWRPLDRQIETMYNNFDPRIMPEGLLPWLGGWIDVVFDHHWPVEKRRLLLKNAVWLFRKRGTRHGLSEFLRLYTGLPVEIVEHRANNLKIGAGARLGQAVALGRKNTPFTFSVRVGKSAAVGDLSEYRDRLTRIIDQEKPAHTRYELNIG